MDKSVARGRTEKIKTVKAQIGAWLREGMYRPGDRFLSARELASIYEVSYETAHVLLDELCGEGLVERRAASGTYIPGGLTILDGVQLLFSSRAQRPQSFGARLLADLTRRLDRERIRYEVTWAGPRSHVAGERFPVLWEAGVALQNCLKNRRAALLLNDRPPPGLDAGNLDSVSIDDYWGGVCAAQLLLRGLDAQARIAVLTGPESDSRSCQRRDGFRSLARAARVVSAGSWFYEDGLRVAGEAMRLGRDGLFCANDRLAEAVLAHCQEQNVACPRLVGFDDAPIAAALNLTTIAIPWEEMIAEAVETIRRRLAGDVSAARQRIVTPRPVLRRL